MTSLDADVTPEKVVRRAWLDLHDLGREAWVDDCTDDVCWVSLLSDGRTGLGRDGMEAVLRGMWEAGMSYTALPYRYSCVNERVIVSVDVCVTKSGARDPDFHAYVVYHLRGGRISRICEYLTFEQALAAANAP